MQKVYVSCPKWKIVTLYSFYGFDLNLSFLELIN